jgi:hypothetical protein
MTRTKVSILLGACLAACSQQAPPRAEYVAFCKREFQIAKDLTQITIRQIDDQRPWISVEKYEALYGALPATGFYRLDAKTGERAAIQAPTPAALIELERKNYVTRDRLRIMNHALGTPLADNESLFGDLSASLEQQDNFNARKSGLIAADATAEDLLPKLEECYRRLR